MALEGGIALSQFKTILLAVVSAAALAATGASAQATRESAGIPQPHLAKAREIALQDNNWRFPGLIACYPDEGQPAQKIIKDPPPTKAMDNLYFLGNGVVSVWAVDTSEGIILIDTMNNQAEADQFILAGMAKVGLDPTRIKAILVSHGHGDHFGGARYLQDKYGAKVYMTALDYDLAEKASAGPNARTSAPRRDVVVADGQSLVLGDTTIKMYITPGHTPGALSLMIQVRDKGQSRTLAYFGGITSKFLTPANHEAFEKSAVKFLKLAQEAKADGYIANHPSYDDSALKLDKIRSTPKAPNALLVGYDSTLRFISAVRECNLNNRDIEAALPPRPAAGRAAAE
jgi:metallo-beta-lactamase class B